MLLSAHKGVARPAAGLTGRTPRPCRAPVLPQQHTRKQHSVSRSSGDSSQPVTTAEAATQTKDTAAAPAATQQAAPAPAAATPAPQHAAPAPATPAPAAAAATAAPQQATDAPAPSQPPQPKAAPSYSAEEAKFHAAYQAAYTMSQLFVQDRPEAVPLTEWETRRKKRDMEEIQAAAKKRGKDPQAVKANLEQLESLLPNLINLHKMKAADWVLLSEDVTGAANKLIALKAEFPGADVFRIMASRPKTLLQPEEAIVANAHKVKALLSKAEDVDAIIQAVPELSDPVALSRSLGFLAASFPGKDPVLLLQENPQILLNLGESNMEDHAEYGEMTTKD